MAAILISHTAKKQKPNPKPTHEKINGDAKRRKVS